MKQLRPGHLALLVAITACKATPTSAPEADAEPADAAVEHAALSRPDGAASPNIIIVLLDTLRPDYLGFMGAKTETAPFLARLAERSAVFENALSTSSWTAPSTASAFTGLYPPQHSVTQGFKAHRALIAKFASDGDADITVNHLPRTAATLPEVLKESGYRTFGLAANINIGPEIGFDRGFDKFERNVRATAAEMVDTVAKWRQQIVAKSPFFLYLHFNDPHVPYHRREPFFTPALDREGDPAARYRSEIGYVDAHLEKLWAMPGLTDDALVVILSDHGEEFMDHGRTEHGPRLYGELNRVLLMIHGPKWGIPSGRYKENVSLIDLLPTLADQVGRPVGKREGTSLMPLFDPKRASGTRDQLNTRCLFGHRMFSSVRNLAVWSITCENWKLIDYYGRRRELYDHSTDRPEQHDLAKSQTEVASILVKRLDAFKARMATDVVRPREVKVKMDKALMERLQTLGYVEDDEDVEAEGRGAI